jgi:hypothetical protein
MLRRRPMDARGGLDVMGGYEILLLEEKAASVERSAKTSEKKKVASQTMEEGSGEGKPKDYKTSKDFIGKDWTDVAF